MRIRFSVLESHTVDLCFIVGTPFSSKSRVLETSRSAESRMQFDTLVGVVGGFLSSRRGLARPVVARSLDMSLLKHSLKFPRSSLSLSLSRERERVFLNQSLAILFEERSRSASVSPFQPARWPLGGLDLIPETPHQSLTFSKLNRTLPNLSVGGRWLDETRDGRSAAREISGVFFPCFLQFKREGKRCMYTSGLSQDISLTNLSRDRARCALWSRVVADPGWGVFLSLKNVAGHVAATIAQRFARCGDEATPHLSLGRRCRKDTFWKNPAPSFFSISKKRVCHTGRRRKKVRGFTMRSRLALLYARLRASSDQDLPQTHISAVTADAVNGVTVNVTTGDFARGDSTARGASRTDSPKPLACGPKKKEAQAESQSAEERAVIHAFALAALLGDGSPNLSVVFPLFSEKSRAWVLSSDFWPHHLSIRFVPPVWHSSPTLYISSVHFSPDFVGGLEDTWLLRSQNGTFLRRQAEPHRARARLGRDFEAAPGLCPGGALRAALGRRTRGSPVQGHHAPRNSTSPSVHIPKSGDKTRGVSLQEQDLSLSLSLFLSLEREFRGFVAFFSRSSRENAFSCG